MASVSSRCASALRRVEDGADAARDRFALLESGDVGLCVLLQMKLAALPRHAGQHRPTRRFQSDVIVGDDQLHAAQAALDQIFQERAPMHFGFRQRAAIRPARGDGRFR
jgi:hypothetical protein